MLGVLFFIYILSGFPNDENSLLQSQIVFFFHKIGGSEGHAIQLYIYEFSMVLEQWLWRKEINAGML
jgi:hypothetical protein